jgi:hypothetical protein
MKTSEYLKEIHPKVNSLLGEIDNEIKDSIKKIKKDYANEMIEEKIKLLKEICEGEGLNFNELKNKYLNEKEKKLIKEQVDTIEVSNESLLDTIEINGKTYFYENKEKGVIYDRKTNKPVGVIKNGLPVLD